MTAAPSAVASACFGFLPVPPSGEPPSASGPSFPSLVAALRTVPEPRAPQGLLHPLQPMLLAVVYAMLCNKHHPAAIAGWVNAHYADWLREAVGFTQPHRPCRTTFHLLLRRLDWQALEAALSAWMRGVAAQAGFDLAPETLALDGKEVRGVRRMSEEALLLISAFAHQSGLTLALRSCPEGQEIAAVRALLAELTLTGRVVTLDALHTQRETAQLILDREGDYLLTAKANQPTLVATLQGCFAPWRAAGQDREVVTTHERGHGRQETRTLVALSVEPEAVDGWPGAAQVFCLSRAVRRGRKGALSTEVVWGVTSLTREEAGAARLLQLNRGHWGIENRSHWVRDVVCREDAGLAFLDNTAEVLAVVRTTILNLLRVHRVKNVAAQLRDNGDRPRDACRFLKLPESQVL